MPVPVASPPGARRGWPATAGILVVAWLTLLGLVIGVGLLITGPLQDAVGPPDNALARWILGERSSSLTSVATLFTLLGDTVPVVVLAIAVALAIWVWQRDSRPALFVALATSGVTAIYLLATNAVSRPRPPGKILDPGLDPTHSFPSGHTGAATAVYGGIVVLVWTYAPRARWWVTPLLVLPVLVMISRLYEGAHHLSDVLTSLVFASIWLTFTAKTLLPGRPTDESARASRTPE